MLTAAITLACALAAGSAPASASLAPQGEPGDPLVITGTIVLADGTTPAAGVTIQLWQADAKGIYCEGACPPGRQARLEATLITGADGRYEIRTIRPGSYPGQRVPGHVHARLSREGCREQFPDEFQFQDDPFISDNERGEPDRQGRFASVMRVAKGPDGTWRAARDS